MAGSPPASTPPEQPGSDPSMEDILASIRRILNEDEAPSTETAAPPAYAGGDDVGEDEVLVLDTSMIVAPGALAGVPSIPSVPATAAEPTLPVPPAAPFTPALIPPPPTPPMPSTSDLLAPETEAAAVSSVGSLLQMLTKERSTQVHRGGPTIEDLVREEIRPLLKGWLDLHLPPLVERLVRIEIERVTGRAAS